MLAARYNGLLWGGIAGGAISGHRHTAAVVLAGML